MANFFLMVPNGQTGAKSKDLFEMGVASAAALKSASPAQRLATEWAAIASFARANGSGGTIAVDSASGSWVYTLGTWLHTHGYGSGAEPRLLARYLERGAAGLGSEVEGFFCIVIGDAARREVAIITDIVGSCHVFMRDCGAATAVASSSLVLATLAPTRIDPVGCQEFLATGIIYDNRTCYDGVTKIGPAEIVRLGRGGILARTRYWAAHELSGEQLAGPRAVRLLWERLTDAAGRIGALYHRPVCDLTGGYDSRAMLAAFLGAGQRVSVTVSGAADSADVVVSRALAQRLALPHVHSAPAAVTTTAQLRAALAVTDGEYDLVEYARILAIHENLRARFDVSINGSFGEVARGYWWELLWPRIGQRRPLDSGKLARARFAAVRYDPALVAAEHRLNLPEHFAAMIERTNEALRDAPNTLQMDHAYLALRMQHWQGRIASSTNQRWPCLSPFMFRSVLEVLLTMQPRQRLRSLVIRQMLARFQPQLAAFPLEHGYPPMPATWRNLVKFLPLIPHFGGRVRRKLGRLLGRRRIEAAPAALEAPRLALWQDPEIREMLDPARMRLGALLDRPAVTEFLRRSHASSFPWPAQWARLLTLECGLRAAEQAARAADRLRARSS